MVGRPKIFWIFSLNKLFNVISYPVFYENWPIFQCKSYDAQGQEKMVEKDSLNWIIYAHLFQPGVKNRNHEIRFSVNALLGWYFWIWKKENQYLTLESPDATDLCNRPWRRCKGARVAGRMMIRERGLQLAIQVLDEDRGSRSVVKRWEIR